MWETPHSREPRGTGVGGCIGKGALKRFDGGGRERKEIHGRENKDNNPQQAAVAEPPFGIKYNIWRCSI